MTWGSATPMHVEVGHLYRVNHQWNLQQHSAVPHWSGALWDSATHGILLSAQSWDTWDTSAQVRYGYETWVHGFHPHDCHPIESHTHNI